MRRVFLFAENSMARNDRSRIVPGELALIEAIRRQAGVGGAGSGALRLGIGDDCAILRPKAGDEICVTTDFTLEGVHFRRAWHPPESVGHRCLTRGLSDLAGMGAEPLAVFLSLAVPRQLPAHWLERFLKGFLALAGKHHVKLAGGDTAQSPGISQSRDGLILADIVAIGQVPRGKALLRSGARVGDLIYVTGFLGGAAAELAALKKNPKRFSKVIGEAPGHPHVYPEPRLAVGRRLRTLAHAMIDLSDGLSTDLTHLCEESHVAAVIDQDVLPVHPLVQQNRDPLGLALNGGEDYELLFTASAAVRFPQTVVGVPIHRIGKIHKRRASQPLITLQTVDGKQFPVEPQGWEHFRPAKSGSGRLKS
jgi:thiamine-monophosphate kinase